MEQARHASAFGAPPALAPTFHELTTDALRAALASAGNPSPAVVLGPDAAGATFSIQPWIRLEVGESGLARASTSLVVRYTDPETGTALGKSYTTTAGTRRPLRGDAQAWFEDGARPLLAMADDPIRQLAKLMTDDLGGRWKSVQGAADAKPRHFAVRQSDAEFSVIVLETTPTGWVVSPLIGNGIPLWRLILLLHRDTHAELDRLPVARSAVAPVGSP